MSQSVQIRFRNVPWSDAVADIIRRKAEGLEGVAGRLASCRVTVELPHKHKHHGNHYRVRILGRADGGAIRVDRDPVEARSHEDVYAAIHDAFEAATQQVGGGLRERARRRAKRGVSGELGLRLLAGTLTADTDELPGSDLTP